MTPQAFDERSAIRHLGGRSELLRELAAAFLKELPAQLKELRQRASRGDREALFQSAHMFKGSFPVFRARDAEQAAFDVERAARTYDAARLRQTVAALEYEVERLQRDLLAFLKPA